MKETTEFETLPGNEKLEERHSMHTVLVFSYEDEPDFIAVTETRKFKEIHEIGEGLAALTGSQWRCPYYLGYEYNVDLELRNEKKRREDEITLFRCTEYYAIDPKFSDCLALYFTGPFDENFIIVCSYSTKRELIDLAYRIQNTAHHMIWDCAPITVKQHNSVVKIAANIAYELGEKEEAYYEGLRSRGQDPAGGD
jgi:hypothetical protein